LRARMDGLKWKLENPKIHQYEYGADYNPMSSTLDCFKYQILQKLPTHLPKRGTGRKLM
jgi:hypothetical protein